LQAEKILKVAARLFATHRFHEARMEDIAAAAEVGKGTVYRYFKDKDELYRALLQQAADQLSQSLQEATAGISDPRGRLEAIITAIADYFHSHPHLFDLIQHSEVMHRSNTASPWQPVREATFSLVEETLHQGQQQGVFPPHDVTLTTLLLLGGLRAVLRFDTRPHSPDLAAQIVDTVLYGALRPRGRGASSA
jgi:AcrR family transcriptional regulator